MCGGQCVHMRMHAVGKRTCDCPATALRRPLLPHLLGQVDVEALVGALRVALFPRGDPYHVIPLLRVVPDDGRTCSSSG